MGWNTKTIDAKGQVFTTSYDAVGNIKQQTENGLRTTTTTYDALNRQKQVTTTYGADTLNTDTNYDEVGNIINAEDAAGHITQYEYDELNRRNKTIDAKSQDTEYKYDAVGNLTEIIDSPIRKTSYTYDNLNRRTDIKDAEHIVTRTTYNEFSEAIAITQNYGGSLTRTTQYQYDQLGRQVQTIDPLNHTTTTTYDEADNVRTVKDANNNTTTYDYDNLNRQTKIVDANNITTQINTYDGFGNITQLEDFGHNKTKYDYDNLNRLTTTTDPRNKQTIQDYDGLGRVKSSADRNNRTKTYTYNINDDLLTETWGDGTVISYTYDKVSNLLTSKDSSSNTTNTYTYDEIYQLTSAETSNSNVNFQYTYDEFGDLNQRQDKVGGLSIATLDYTYNNNHQLAHLTQAGTGLTTQNIGFTYDKLSQLKQTDRQSATNPGHLLTDYDYDGAGRLIDIHHRFNTTTIGHDVYNYDDGNRLSTKSGTDGNSTVGYGNDNQISSVTNSTHPNEAYSFNALGIRAGWATDALDSRRVVNDGQYQYQYDDEGNLTQKTEIATSKVTTYEWDDRNRLMKVASGTQTVEYLYDAEDKRVGQKVNGVVKEKYVYDGADIALVVDAAGTLVERYLYGGGTDNVLSVEKGGAVIWSLADRQGSVVDLVDASGTVLNHFVYDSFGNRTGTTAVGFRFGYTGRELDAQTGLYYYRARYYDPMVGRFISEDPIGFSAGDTNLYRYVNNSPTNFTDPSGEWANFAIGAAIGAGLDLGVQLWQNGGDFSKIKWDSVLISGISGAIGGGIGGALLKQGTSLAARTALNAGVGFNLGYYGKMGENAWRGEDLTQGTMQAGIFGGLGGAAGELIPAGIQGGWRKLAYPSNLGKAGTQLGGQTVHYDLSNWENALKGDLSHLPDLKNIKQLMDWNPSQSEAVLQREVEKIRLNLLKSNNDLNSVLKSARGHGIDLDEQALFQIKQYNFNSAGINFNYANYNKWQRLASGNASVNDAAYLLHEATEIGQLKQLTKQSGFDFLGKKYMKMNKQERELWSTQFNDLYSIAHNKAVETEYRFMSKQIKLRSGVDLGEDGYLLAILAEPKVSVREDQLKNFKINGTSLGKSPNLSNLQYNLNNLKISSATIRQFGIADNPTLSGLMARIQGKRF